MSQRTRVSVNRGHLTSVFSGQLSSALTPPGAIRITAATLRLAEGYVDVKPLGPIPVKGLTEPVEVFEVTTVEQRVQQVCHCAIRIPRMYRSIPSELLC